MNRNRIVYSVMVIALGLSACQPMATPLVEDLEPAAASTAVPTNTPAPTRTPEPTATLVPTATNTPVPPTSTPRPNYAATLTAEKTATAEAFINTTVDAELKKYDLSIQEGYLGWRHDPVDLRLDTYGEGQYYTDYDDVVVKDFVLSTDMIWETTTGLAGCALAVRAEEGLERGKYYSIGFMRLSGRPAWDIEYFRLGKFQRNVTGKILDAVSLDANQGAKNHIVVIVRGEKLAVYANGERLGVFTDSKLTEGYVAFQAWQESGETTCTFVNSWMWVLDETQ